MECGTIKIKYNNIPELASLVAALTNEGVQFSVRELGDCWEIKTYQKG